MCNAKPGRRCQKDSFNILQLRVNKFVDYTEKIDTTELSREQFKRVDEMAKAIDEQKAFYYATAGAQLDPYDAMTRVSRLNKEILAKNQDFIDQDEISLFQTGQYLGRLQEYADRYRRENKKSQLDTARKMKTIEGFDLVVRGFEQKFAADEDAQVNKFFGSERPQNWEHLPAVVEIKNKYAAKAASLRRAFEIADREAGDIIQRDKSKNSKNYEIDSPSGVPATVSYWKTYDGSFEATSSFRIRALSADEAKAKTKEMFTWPAKIDVVQLGNSDSFAVSTTYMWRGSEKVEDMHNHHLRFWKPSKYVV